jgi:hemerythrin-like domain-containing protein
VPPEVSVAKKATRKKTGKAGAARKKTPARPAKRAAARTTSRKTSKRKAAKAAAKKKPAVRKVAARKTAARSAATRKRRTSPKPRAASRAATAAATVRGTIAGAVAGVADRLGLSGSEPDAIDILEREHRRFEDLLAQGEETTERATKGRPELLETLASALNAHELMEEKVLYPALQSHPQAREVVLEGFQEHHVADLIVEELRAVAPDDEQWGAKFKVLKENIEHHIQEEEGEMFRLARSIFSRDELRELATRMLALKPLS